ncbi:MAG TPA: phosphatidylserine decarboxylase family protein [Acidobacteriaceae bacterium]|nr:phosphatidylserine decarboxylase family protein [Acidobacteriaceae bacterium]
MVRDGYFYGLGFGAVGVLVWVATHSMLLTAIPILLAAFFLWFFRDPERAIPEAPGLIVSPADGKVTLIETVETDAGPQRRISIFLNVFNVHVNRAPIAGNVQLIDYQKGKYLNAMNPESAIANERNYVEVAGELCTVAFTQIAGLLARRIVFRKKVGDWVHRGERVGLIKFGSRVDVVFPVSCEVQVRVGQIVHGGSSVLAIMPSSDMEDELLAAISSDEAPFGLVTGPVR